MTSLLSKSFIASPRARAYAKKIQIALDQIKGSGPNGRIIEQDVIYFSKSSDIKIMENNSIKKQSRKITPLAQNISKIEKINIEQVRGSGVEGKIYSADILKHINQTPNGSEHQKIILSGIRNVIAKKMTESKRNVPHVTLTAKTDATPLVNYRNSFIEKNNFKISFTDLIIKIVGESLRQHPKVNVSLEEGMLTYYNDVNIGLAVALEEGLIVPVIHNADRKSLLQISVDTKEKVNRAKAGKLRPADIERSRFTISNLGMYEVDAFTPIINQPESAILGVGRIVEDIIVEKSQIRIGKTMILSLSFDHRVMDGVPAAEFLGKIKKFIENPEEILSIQN